MKKYIFILLFFAAIFSIFNLSAKTETLSHGQDSTRLALENWRKKDSLAQWLSSQKKISQQFRSQQKLDTAKTILTQALQEIWRKAETQQEKTQLAWVLVNRAYLYEVEGFFLEAQADYIAADKIFTQLNEESYHVARFVRHPLGNIYTRLGENELAAYYLRKALRKYDTLKVNSDLIDAHNDLGIVYINQGKYQQAIEIVKEGIDLKTENPLNRVLLYNSKANAHLLLEQFELGNNAIDSAFYYINESLTFYAESSYFTELIRKYAITSHRFRGLLLTGLNQTEAAQVEFEKALQYSYLFKNKKHRQLAKVYLGLAKNRQKQQLPLQALRYYQQSFCASIITFNDTDLFVNPHPRDLYAEVSLGEALLGKAESAKEQYWADKDLKWLLLAKECYLLYFNWEKRIRSEYHYESSKLSFTEELHGATESALELFALLQKVQPDGNWAKLAFQCMEQSKGVLLSESMVNLFQQIPELKQDSSLHQLQLLKKQYYLLANQPTDSSKRKEALQERILLLETNLRERFPYYHTIKSNVNNSLSPILVQQYLKKQQAELSSYFVGSNTVFCVLVRANRFQLYAIDKTDYDRLTDHFLAILHQTKTGATEYGSTAWQLYNLLTPFERYPREKNWIIIPDERLNLIPFEALVDKREKTSGFMKLSYLVKSRSISYAPSAKFLLRSSTVDSTAKPFLGIAPDFSNSSNAFLQHAQQEVESGHRYFGGDVLTGAAIQKKKLIERLPNYQIVHWVSHAGVDSSQTNGAWIAVNGTGNSKARLFPPELLPLQLSTSLLTLNACETAVGKYKAGEGIYSLSRGFAYAGAQNILTNLWQANHEVNNQLMRNFYAQLEQEGNISAALSQAKRAYLLSENTDELGAHPYFWAAPVLIGNNRNIILNPGQADSSVLLYTVIAILICLTLLFFLLREKIFS